MARLFLTGGQGMVGRNLRDHPGLSRWEVLAPARAELELSDARALQDWLARHRPDAVVHAAGLVGGIQANMAEPVRYLAENARIGLNVIEACRAARVPVRHPEPWGRRSLTRRTPRRPPLRARAHRGRGRGADSGDARARTQRQRMRWP